MAVLLRCAKAARPQRQEPAPAALRPHGSRPRGASWAEQARRGEGRGPPGPCAARLLSLGRRPRLTSAIESLPRSRPAPPLSASTRLGAARPSRRAFGWRPRAWPRRQAHGRRGVVAPATLWVWARQRSKTVPRAGRRHASEDREAGRALAAGWAAPPKSVLPAVERRRTDRDLGSSTTHSFLCRMMLRASEDGPGVVEASSPPQETAARCSGRRSSRRRT